MMQFKNGMQNVAACYGNEQSGSTKQDLYRIMSVYYRTMVKRTRAEYFSWSDQLRVERL